MFRGAYTLADFKASRVRAGASVYSSTISGAISLYVVCEWRVSFFIDCLLITLRFEMPMWILSRFIRLFISLWTQLVLFIIKTHLLKLLQLSVNLPPHWSVTYSSNSPNHLPVLRSFPPGVPTTAQKSEFLIKMNWTLLPFPPYLHRRFIITFSAQSHAHLLSNVGYFGESNFQRTAIRRHFAMARSPPRKLIHQRNETLNALFNPNFTCSRASHSPTHRKMIHYLFFITIKQHKKCMNVIIPSENVQEEAQQPTSK